MITIQLDTGGIAPRVQDALAELTNPIHSSTPAGQEAMNVGVPVHLTLDVGGGTLTNVAGITWSISGGDPIKDYEISSYDPANPEDPDGDIRGYLTAFDTIPLDLAADLNGVAEITFFFTAVATGVVTVVAEVDGTPEVGSYIFDVRRDPRRKSTTSQVMEAKRTKHRLRIATTSWENICGGTRKPKTPRDSTTTIQAASSISTGATLRSSIAGEESLVIRASNLMCRGRTTCLRGGRSTISDQKATVTASLSRNATRDWDRSHAVAR